MSIVVCGVHVLTNEERQVFEAARSLGVVTEVSLKDRLGLSDREARRWFEWIKQRPEFVRVEDVSTD